MLDGSLERLGRMMSFASGATCRHRLLVEHFGQEWARPEGLEAGVEGCGACDVCLGELQRLEDGQVVAQKILSCVVHCEQRYGAGHVTDVLRGAANQAVQRAGHDRVSTHGLLSEHPARVVRGWIDQLVAQEHLRVAGGRYPTLSLSRTGLNVLRGEQDATLYEQPGLRKAKKSRRPAALEAEVELTPEDEALFEKLRSARRKLAKERGVPPYLIFGDRTLLGMASRRPKSQAELLSLKGVGEKKAADLGELFLAEIESFEADRGSPAVESQG